jgi:hypothetical protein
MCDAHQLAPPVAFFHLAVDQARFHLPSTHVTPSTTQCEPLAKVGRESIEIQIEAITGEERQAARGQALSERVDELMRHVLGAGAELKYGKNLRQGINGQPQPEDLFGAAQPGSDFIQLHVRELEGAEIVLV